MRLIVGNVKTRSVIGGVDHLLGIDILEELRDYLAIRVKGYQYSSLYKKRVWDGYRRFITTKGEFATGFLPNVAEFLIDLGVKLVIEDERTNVPRLREKIDPYIGEIDGKIWTGRPYQIGMVQTLNNYLKIGEQNVYFPRGIFDVATNGGKNSITALIVKNLENPSDIVLFTVGSRLIYDQAVEFFSQAFDEPVGQIRSGKVELKRFTVAMAKTALNRVKDSLNVETWMKKVSVLIVDESDEAGANQYAKLLSVVGAGMRIFVSGTPLDADKGNNMVAIGLSGKCLGKITNKFLIENGYSQKPQIHILHNKSTKRSINNYKEELRDFIHLSENRASLVLGVVKKHADKSILISFNTIEHGKFMYDYLLSKGCVDIDIIHGTTKRNDDIIDSFKKGKIRILLASMVIKKGVNMPVIEVLIQAQEGMSVITVKQLAGRALRKKDNNDDVLIYGFYDSGSKHLSKHSRKRITIFKKEGFEIITHYEEKRGKPVI